MQMRLAVKGNENKKKNNAQDATATATGPVTKDYLQHGLRPHVAANEDGLPDVPQYKAIDSDLNGLTFGLHNHVFVYMYLMQKTNTDLYASIFFAASNTISVHDAE